MLLGAQSSSEGRAWTLEEETQTSPLSPLGPAWVWQLQSTCSTREVSFLSCFWSPSCCDIPSWVLLEDSLCDLVWVMELTLACGAGWVDSEEDPYLPGRSGHGVVNLGWGLWPLLLPPPSHIQIPGAQGADPQGEARQGLVPSKGAFLELPQVIGRPLSNRGLRQVV